MQSQDVLVGAMAAALGLLTVFGAASGRTWLLERRWVRSLVGTFGQLVARILLALFGVGLIVLGALIALGWRLNWL
jgi:hypothetical protein